MRATLLLFLFFVAPAVALPPPPVTLTATVTRVVDGDTIDVEVAVWPGLFARTAIRLVGMDAPELFHPRCPEEQALAQHARDSLVALLPPGRQVWLLRPHTDKFGGRMDARVLLSDGTDIAERQIAAGLAKPYGGGTRSDWCPAKRGLFKGGRFVVPIPGLGH